MQIFLGPAGSPEKSTIEGISAIKRLELHAMEVQFTHGIKMSLDLARKIGQMNDVKLSVHAPYYINLNSEDEKKKEDSKKRIIDSCERAHLMGANPVVFHPAFYGKKSKEETYDITKDAIKDIQHVIKRKGWNVKLAPEVMGRLSQFGDLDEILGLVKNLKCDLCVDVCHIYARNIGNINYTSLFDKLEDIRGHKHFHFSGVRYGKKGEISHTVLGNPPFKPFAREIIEREISTTIISESPITWKDSLKMKKIFEKLGHSFSS